MTVARDQLGWHRWAFLFAYSIHLSAWLCYFRYYWFCDDSTPTAKHPWLMWLVRVVIILCSPLAIHQIIGFLTHFPSSTTYDREEPEGPKGPFPPLIFRVVSRGDDACVLQRGIESHSHILQRLGVTRWLYQLVVEKPVQVEGQNVEVIVVPAKFRTPNNTLFKARNLAFAVSHPTRTYRQLAASSEFFYLVHLDEETLVTFEAMSNVLKFCQAGKFRFGHGLIVNGWHKVVSAVATYTDCWRASVDVGYIFVSYRLRHRCQVVKGGFFVVRNDLEEIIGWDFGEAVTAEDFHLGRLLDIMSEPVDFIEGVIMEESPITVVDIIRQRSRWLAGFFRTLVLSDQGQKRSIGLYSGLCTWFSIPLITSVLIIGCYVAPLDYYYPVIDDFCTVIMASMPFYFVYGAQLTFRLPLAKRLLFTLINVSPIPMIVALTVESLAVFHAIYTLILGGGEKFFVTKKSSVRRTLSNKLR